MKIIKSKRNYYVGITLVIIGISLFVFYYTTGEVFFFDFDQVTQIEGAKISNYVDYITHARYEFMLLILWTLSFFSGVVILFIHRIRTRKTFNSIL